MIDEESDGDAHKVTTNTVSVGNNNTDGRSVLGAILNKERTEQTVAETDHSQSTS